MRAFLEINSAGSFQAAAERLHITQSAISARIGTLEDRLNQKLFNRKRSGAELTDAGLRFLRHAQNCVQSWERAQQEIARSIAAGHQVTFLSTGQKIFSPNIPLPFQILPHPDFR